MILFVSFTPNWEYSKDTFWNDLPNKPTQKHLKKILLSEGFRDVEILPNLRCV